MDRYIVSINIMDHTSSIWTTAFNDTAEAMLGISANELIKIRVSWILLTGVPAWWQS